MRAGNIDSFITVLMYAPVLDACSYSTSMDTLRWPPNWMHRETNECWPCRRWCHSHPIWYVKILFVTICTANIWNDKFSNIRFWFSFFLFHLGHFFFTSGKKCCGNLAFSLVATASMFPVCMLLPSTASHSCVRKFHILMLAIDFSIKYKLPNACDAIIKLVHQIKRQRKQ